VGGCAIGSANSATRSRVRASWNILRERLGNSGERIGSKLRIPVKWATDSASKWARVGRASYRGKNIIAEVAHFSQ